MVVVSGDRFSCRDSHSNALRISGTPFTPGETGIVQTQIKKTQKTKTAKHTYIACEPVSDDLRSCSPGLPNEEKNHEGFSPCSPGPVPPNAEAPDHTAAHCVLGGQRVRASPSSGCHLPPDSFAACYWDPDSGAFGPHRPKRKPDLLMALEWTTSASLTVCSSLPCAATYHPHSKYGEAAASRTSPT